jgi:energy-coupling factor transporter ATP-binding protein EcfA2
LSETVQPKPIRKKELVTTIYMTRETRDKLKVLKKELGFRSYDALINHSAIALQEIHRDVMEPATFNEIFLNLDTRPVILTGLSGSGKSTTARNLLAQLPPELNVFVIDSSGTDYPELRSLDFGQVFAHNWGRGKGERLRYRPDPNRDVAKLLVNQVVGRLFTVMPSGELKDWVVIVDEANRYRDTSLKDFVIESRKWVRKTIVITTAWKDFEEVGRVFKPQPRAIEA